MNHINHNPNRRNQGMNHSKHDKLCLIRLEEEEMQKQKVQLEKVQVEAKLKKIEDDLVQVEDANVKVGITL